MARASSRAPLAWRQNVAKPAKARKESLACNKEGVGTCLRINPGVKRPTEMGTTPSIEKAGGT